MADREKLTDAMNDVKAVENLLRKQGQSWYADILSDAFDTLALLREQEPVKPNPTGIEPNYNCGACRMPITQGYPFCPWCGKEILWNV